MSTEYNDYEPNGSLRRSMLISRTRFLAQILMQVQDPKNRCTITISRVYMTLCAP